MVADFILYYYMDNNTYLLISMIILELFNLIGTIISAIGHFLKNEDGRIKSSKCCGGQIDYNENKV